MVSLSLVSTAVGKRLVDQGLLESLASVAGHTFVNTIAPQLPAGYRVILVERNEFIVHLPTVVRSCIVPGES